MVKGIAPPPVRTIGIVYTVLTGVLIYRRFDWPETGPMLTETASLAGVILFIIDAANCMVWRGR